MVAIEKIQQHQVGMGYHCIMLSRFLFDVMDNYVACPFFVCWLHIYSKDFVTILYVKEEDFVEKNIGIIYKFICFYQFIFSGGLWENNLNESGLK